MTTSDEFQTLGVRLTQVLHLHAPPIGITFSSTPPNGVAPFDAPMSAPAEDGRRGRVAAGCVFWIEGATRTFTTVPEDHGNCSVGRFTHGLARLEDIASNGDVATLLESGWVDEAAVSRIPSLDHTPGAITYGPLEETPASVEPDVVLLRINGRQLMVLSDALPEMRIEGKPQCHVVAIAHNEQVAAASVGCALSRARTGMTSEEMTCALPGRRLLEIVEAVEHASETDTAVARYAATDARRFERRAS